MNNEIIGLISFRQCNKSATYFVWYTDDKWGLQKCACNTAEYLEAVWCHTQFFWRAEFCLYCKMITLMPTQNGDMLQGKCSDIYHERLFLGFPKKCKYKMKMCFGNYFSFILCRLYIFLIFLTLSRIYDR